MAVNCPGCSPRFEFSLAYWFRIAVSWQAIAGQWGEGSLRGEGLIGWPSSLRAKAAGSGSLPLAWDQAYQKQKAWRHCVHLFGCPCHFG